MFVAYCAMRVLAIDTALGGLLGGSARHGAGRHYRQRERADAARSRRSADAAGRRLSIRLEFPDIDRIVVTTGPGSFTGLRVGISAARGIALAADRPAVGVSTLRRTRRRIWPKT